MTAALSLAAHRSPPPTIRAEAPDIPASLDRAIRSIEGAFLAAGDVLSNAVDGVGDLIAALDRLTAAMDPQMVASTTADLTHAAATLHDLPHALGRRRSGLEGLVELGGALSTSLADMRQSLSYLRIFTLYVKVAAAGTRDAAQQFNTFADEISDCIAAGLAHVAALDLGLGGLDRSLRQAIGLESDLAVRCAGMLPATPDAIVSTAAALGSHRGKVTGAASDVRTLAASVRTKVGRILAALQVGDSTRQRLEHARDGLLALDAAVAGLDPDIQASLLAVGRELVSAQLRSASEDFTSEITAISRNMGALAADAHEILGLLGVVYDHDEADENGFLDRLEGHVDAALGLVDQVQAADREAAELGLAAADAAPGLLARLDDVQRLQRDVQQMALNTRLKCSRIGTDGQSLAVIALELREQASQLERAASRALATIGEMERGARTLVEATADPAQAGAQAAAESLNGALARIREAAASIDADQQSLSSLGRSVVLELQTAATGIDFNASVGDSLAEALAAMAASVGGAQVCGPEVASEARAFFADMARRYTMAQERSIHQVIAAAFGVVEEAPSSPEADAPVVEDLDDLLF